MKLPSLSPLLQPLLQPLCTSFDARTARERLLMIAAVGALLYFATDAMLLRPQQQQLRQFTTQADTKQAELQRVNAQVAELSAKLAKNNDAVRQAELDELKRIIAEADALLSEDDGSSLRLSALLESMLRTTPGLQLMSLKTLPVSPLLPRTGPKAADGSDLKPSPPMTGSAKAAPEPPPVAVYQHAVEIVIQGNYLALLPYMEKLRRYPKRLFWTSASLEVVKHPDSRLHLTLSAHSKPKATPLR